MNIHESVSQWLEAPRTSATEHRGLVPTMGALHEGHASLIRQCVRDNAQSVVTIYVNPTQFNNPDDLEKYPDTLDADIRLLDELGVTDLILPQYKELYPFDFTLYVDESLDSTVLCGKDRVGHFKGVLSVVMKLFNLTQARRAYFGKKDFQQYRLVSKMVEAFFMPTQVIGMETIRDDYGLALSSRNRHLSEQELTLARQMNVLLKNESLSAGEISEQLNNKGFRVDYCEERWGRRFVAAHLGTVRLIDNVELTTRE